MNKINIIYFITQVFFFNTMLLLSFHQSFAGSAIINRPSLEDISTQLSTSEMSQKKYNDERNNYEKKTDERKTVCTKSIRSNFRKGPDTNSPIEYEILVRGYPLKVIKFIDTWYATEDFEGNIAWISQINVKEHCGVIVSSVGLSFVYFSPSAKAKILMSLQRGFIVHSVECFTKEWCSVKIGEKTGWMLRENLWGNIQLN